MRRLRCSRQGAAHDAYAPHSGFASASLLRAHLRDGDFAFCAPFLPPAARAVWKKAAGCGEAPVALPEDTLLALLRTALYQGRLRTGSADGFDERLRKAVYTAHSFSDAVEKARTRRFPAARGAPCAPAVCARCGDGRTCLPGLSARTGAQRARTGGVKQLPAVIVKPATEKRLPENLQAALCRDAFADDLFALALPDPERRIGGGHFCKTPFCLR